MTIFRHWTETHSDGHARHHWIVAGPDGRPRHLTRRKTPTMTAHQQLADYLASGDRDA